MRINETCEHYCGDEDCAKCDFYGILVGGCAGCDIYGKEEQLKNGKTEQGRTGEIQRS